MQTQIKTKNILKNGLKYKQILEIKGVLTWNELPVKYKESSPLYCLKYDPLRILVVDDTLFKDDRTFGDRRSFVIGEIIPEDLFSMIIKSMKKAGQNLSNIKKYNDWIDKIETYKI